MIIIILILLMVCCVSLSIGLGIWGFIEFTKEEPVDGYWSEWTESVPCVGEYGGSRIMTRTCTEPIGDGKQCVDIDGGIDSKSVPCITFEEYTKQKENERKRLEYEQEQLAATAERERLARKLELTNKWTLDPNSLTAEENTFLFGESDSVSETDNQELLLSTLKTQLDQAEETFIAIQNGLDTFISVEEAGKTFGQASLLYWPEYLKQNPDISDSDRTEISNKMNIARKLTEISVTVTAGTAVPNQPLKSYTCPDDKYVTAIIGNHDPWLNQIGIKCGPYSTSPRDRQEKNKVYSTTNTSTSTVKSDFSLERSTGFNSIDTFYSNGGIVGLKVGNHEIGGDFDNTNTTKQTLSCPNGRIKGIKASAGGGTWNIVNELALVCKDPQKPLSSETIKWTGKTRKTREQKDQQNKQDAEKAKQAAEQARQAAITADNLAKQNCLKNGQKIQFLNEDLTKAGNWFRLDRHNKHELRWQKKDWNESDWTIHTWDSNSNCITSDTYVYFKQVSDPNRRLYLQRKSETPAQAHITSEEATTKFKIHKLDDIGNKYIKPHQRVQIINHNGNSNWYLGSTEPGTDSDGYGKARSTHLNSTIKLINI